MISHRLRALTTGISVLVMGAALASAAPGVAAGSLQISSPPSGTTITGDVVIVGSIVSDEAVSIVVGLAPQLFGDCGRVDLTDTLALESGGGFTSILSTALVDDGRYCLIAVADAGRLSTVIGDVTINNAGGGGLQLPTESLDGDGDGDGTAAGVSDAAVTRVELFSTAALFGPLLLVVSGFATAAVIAFALVQRRRTTH